MNARFRGILVVAAAVIGGGLGLWAVRAPEKLNEAGALCVLKLQAGATDTSASFTTSQTTKRFHVGVRPGAARERLTISVTGQAGLMCRVNTDANHFSFGLDIPPGTYTASLTQELGGHGGIVVISDRETAGITGWQILSRSWLGLLVASGLWALFTRRSINLKHRAVSACVFQHLLLGFVLIFLYLLFHEGGHSFGELLMGRYDFASSDFWGIRGTPHSGGKGGPALEPWQQALISGGGPLLPTLAGWGLFGFWSSRVGRDLRRARPVVDLYLCAIVAILLLPFIAVGGCLLSVISDGDWQGFINNVPGPLWLVKTMAWGILVVNGLILWRVLPELHRAWKAQVSRLQHPSSPESEPLPSSV